MTAEKETSFAAWLINIDRFYQPGPTVLIQTCGDILLRYLDIPALLGILSGSEEWKNQREIVDYAFRLSLCESEKSERKTTVRNLTSVFSRVTTGEQESPEKQYYPLVSETADAPFPVETADDSHLDQLAGQFVKELSALKDSPPESWEKFIVVFDTLSRKYMWCITASDYEGEDISLYNQSRIAAAIAACITRSGGLSNTAPFKLVLCDFSGIQKYVFSVATVSESGVAKRLRARSFFVDITVSVISQVIIQRFTLTQNHILLLTGGKFYLLLPNTPDSEPLLKAIETEMEENFFDMFKGKVAIHLVWLTTGPEGLENYSGSVLKLSRQLSDKKVCAFHNILTGPNGWATDRFILENDLAEKRLCTSCGSELTDKESSADEESSHCPICRMQTEIGGRLPRTRYISYYRGRKPGAYPIYGDYSIGLWKELKKDDAFLIEQLNSSRFTQSAYALPVRTKYMTNHIPTDENGDVMTFSDIADKSSGTQKLAVLKADVDNLGYIFADGLRSGKRHFGTISRVNTMSRLLEIFFSGYINHLISRRDEYHDVYSVFSGGDDLFLIGPWDVMPKLAAEIAAEFRRYTAGNPALTISAAVSIFHPKEHIATLAEVSEQALKSVKEEADPVIYPQKDGRDGVSFMGNKYAWPDLRIQLQTGDRLAALLSQKQLGTAILRRIAIYSGMYRKFLADHDVMSLMFEPLFHYDRQRNYDDMEKKKANNDELRWFLDHYAKDLTDNAADSRIRKKDLYFAEATVRYAMDKTKEERM